MPRTVARARLTMVSARAGMSATIPLGSPGDRCGWIGRGPPGTYRP
jgi:hypothetical protein